MGRKTDRYEFRGGPTGTFVRKHGGHVSLRRSISVSRNLAHKKNYLLPTGVLNVFWGRKRATAVSTAANGRLTVKGKLETNYYVSSCALPAGLATKRPRVISWNIDVDRKGIPPRVYGRMYVILAPDNHHNSAASVDDWGQLAKSSPGQQLEYNLTQLPSTIEIGVPEEFGTKWSTSPASGKSWNVCIAIDKTDRTYGVADDAFTFELHPYIKFSSDS